MPWGWNKAATVEVNGGPLGTPAEAKETNSWPDYEAAYLKARLSKGVGRYNTASLSGNQENVYLDNVAKDYKKDAEQQLRIEFDNWLQGKHEDNVKPRVYENAPDKPVRCEPGGKLIDNWVPTSWHTDQLTHLDGVREYLRDGEEKMHR